MRCEICNSETGQNGHRMGVCWECATAESIIDEGLDMHDRGPGDRAEPAKTAMEKVRFLHERGCMK